MGFFGFGSTTKLRAELDAQLEKTEKLAAQISDLQTSVKRLEKNNAEKDKELAEAREARQAALRKAEKVATADKKAADTRDRIKHLESEVETFRKAMLEAKRETERARAELEEVKKAKAEEVAPAPAPVPVAAPEPVAPPADLVPKEKLEQAERRLAESRDRIDSLERQLVEARETREAAKDRAVKAEKLARDADTKLRRDGGKNDAALRDLRHHLKSERSAYRILQLQYEAQVDRVRGVQQQADAILKGQAESSPAN